jgi:hypothetical protein
MKRVVFVCLCVVYLAHTSTAWGQTPTSEGYPGVTPGKTNPPPAEKKQQLGAKVVTWPGFQTLPDGSTQFFVQVWGQVTPTQRMHGKSMVVSLPKTRVALTNNKSPLVTTYFNTPVGRAYLKAKPQGTELHLEMKANRVAGNLSQEPSTQSGYTYVYVTFPKGNYAEFGATELTPKLRVIEAQRSSEKSSAPTPSSNQATPSETAPSPSVDGVPRSASDAEKPPMR